MKDFLQATGSVALILATAIISINIWGAIGLSMYSFGAFGLTSIFK